MDNVIIFDFDGTIADSFLTTIRTVYKAVHPNKIQPEEDISRLRAMNMYQLSRVLHIPMWRFIFLTRRVRQLMRQEISGILLIPGMDIAIKALSKKHTLFVLSSNSTSNVQAFLHRNELDTYFTGIFGEASPISKKRKLVKLLSQYGIQKQHAWYVGDEALDIKAAKHAGIQVVAVAWGYSNIHVLESNRPNALVFSPDELCVLFNAQ